MAPLHPASPEPVESDESGGREDGDDERPDDERSEHERREGMRRLKVDLAVARSPALSVLEERLYKHVVDCIDFDALFGLEQLLWHAVERLGHGALDNETGLSHRLIERALTRAALDPWNAFKDVPFGITKAEERAVRFDRECLFCKYEEQAADDAAPEKEHDHGGDACSLCDAVARDWRAQHADKLREARDRRASSQRSQRSKSGRA